MRSSSHNSNHVLFLLEIVFFASRIVKIFLHVFGCFYCQQSFCLQGFFTPTALLISLYDSYISSQSSPSMPLYNAWQKAPVVINQVRAPSFWFNVVDIYQSLRGIHSFSSLCRLTQAHKWAQKHLKIKVFESLFFLETHCQIFKFTDVQNVSGPHFSFI